MPARTWWVALALLALGGACRPDPIGAPCQRDDDCGSGYDCHLGVCFQVCTKDAECRTGQRCARYRCVTPGARDPSNQARPGTVEPPADAPPTPPVPDPTVAELRAIRREVELLRQDVRLLLEAQGITPGAAELPAPAPPHPPAPTPAPTPTP